MNLTIILFLILFSISITLIECMKRRERVKERRQQGESSNVPTYPPSTYFDSAGGFTVTYRSAENVIPHEINNYKIEDISGGNDQFDEQQGNEIDSDELQQQDEESQGNTKVRKNTSPLWEYFIKIKNDNGTLSAICKFNTDEECKERYPLYSGAEKRLIEHLSKMHSTEYEVYKRNIEINKSNMQQSSTKLYGAFKIEGQYAECKDCGKKLIFKSKKESGPRLRSHFERCSKRKSKNMVGSSKTSNE